MAHIAIHEIIADRYIQKHQLEINNEHEFVKGSVAPDLNDEMTERRIDKDSSHYGKWSNGEVKTNINKFLEDDKVDINEDYWKGYFLHLLTDHYFYNKHFNEEFEDMKKNHDSFGFDYYYIFKEIFEKYQFTLSKYTIKYINIKEGKTRYLKLDKIIDFIEEISNMNIKDEVQIIKQKGMEGLNDEYKN